MTKDPGSKSFSAERRKERARKRTMKAALEHFDASMPGRFRGRAWARDRIKAAKVPLREAKRLIVWFRTQEISGTVDDADDIGFADVQELRIRILRRDYVVDYPQACLLARMEHMIVLGELDRDRFNAMAVILMAMPPALPEPVRRVEATWARESDDARRMRLARETSSALTQPQLHVSADALAA